MGEWRGEPRRENQYTASSPSRCTGASGAGAGRLSPLHSRGRDSGASMPPTFDVSWLSFAAPAGEAYSVADLVGACRETTRRLRQEGERTVEEAETRREVEHHTLPKFRRINVSGRFSRFHAGHGRALSLAVLLLEPSGTLVVDVKRTEGDGAGTEGLDAREAAVREHIERYLLGRSDCGVGISVETRHADTPSVNWDPTVDAFVVCEEKAMVAEAVGLERALAGTGIPVCLTVPIFTLPDGTPVRT